MVDWRETDACAEDVLDACSLPEEGVDDGGSPRNERCLAQVAEHRQHRVEALEVGVVANAIRDPLAHVSEDDKIEDDRRGEEGVLTRVVHDDGVVSAQH